MNFSDFFNLIYQKLDCTQSELCNASNLSAPVISRYLSGAREPALDSDQLKALVLGISKIADSKNLNSKDFNYDKLLNKFNELIAQKEVIYHSFFSSFNNIIENLNINMKELAGALNFDVSYLYRVKSGERHPVDLDYFCELLADYIVSHKNTRTDISIAAQVLSCRKDELKNANIYKVRIIDFLTHSDPIDDIPNMSSFLDKLEEFNLDEFIKVIHFDDVKVPSMPFQFPSSKYYFGAENMRKAELDFLRLTVQGKSKESVFMCSYMPMEELAEDMDFGKKWMFGIAMIIKKGLHLNVIHNLNRPMNELMLGFEAWIPIYMTGQVSPYHIPDYTSDIFRQINYCSGSAALMGECIEGSFEEGRYYVTNNKGEIAYYKRKSNALLKKAKPLMDIYTIKEKSRFESFSQKDASTEGDRRTISSSLPDFTIPTEILDSHLANTDSKQKQEILSYIKNSKNYTEEILKNYKITYDTSTILSKEEYYNHPAILRFPMIFSDFESVLSYEEYCKHLESTKKYTNSHKNFSLNHINPIPFTNISITVVYGKYFMINKSKAPNIHFVIYHKKMLAAMENFYIAFQE